MTRLTHTRPLQPTRCPNHTNTPQPRHYTDLQQATLTEPANLPNPSLQTHPKNNASAPYNLAATLPCSRSRDNPHCLALQHPSPKRLSMQCFSNQPSDPNGSSKTSRVSILRVESCDGSVRSRTCLKNKKQNAAPTSTRCCKHTLRSPSIRGSSWKPMRLRGAFQYASLTNSRPDPFFDSYASLPRCQSDYWTYPDPPILPMYSKPRG